MEYTKSKKEIKDDKFIKKYNMNSIGVNGELTMIDIKHPNLMKSIEYIVNSPYIEFHYKYYNKSCWIDLIDIYNNNNPLKSLIKELYDNKKTISLQLINVVNFLHNQNIVHRDIKLDNILYNSEKEKIILCDFEYCKKITEYPNKIKKNDIIVGTPLYFAPEMSNKSLNFEIDYKKIDIWNIGLTIYILFFNTFPDYKKIFWNNDENIKLYDYKVKELFISTLNIYPEQRKSLNHILKLDYFK